MTIQAGSVVSIAAPFNAAFPGEYPVIHVFTDGSAAVMVPGWVQQGSAFDESQGANFASTFLVDSGTTVNLASLQIPTDVVVVAPVPSVAVTSASSPAINGTYPIDAAAQQNIAAVTLYCLVNGKFPAGQSTVFWLDTAGTPHVFATVALWNLFASAVADFVAKQTLGQTPSQPVQIA